MKKLILSLAALCCVLPLLAQAAANYFPDEIVGIYSSKHKGDEYKACITVSEDGIYSAQLIWMKNSVDPITGQKYMDTKNPDKSLRSLPCDRAVIITGLKYNEEKKCWDRGRLYDPKKGVKMSCKAFFEPDGRLCIKTLAGVGSKFFWRKVEE